MNWRTASADGTPRFCGGDSAPPDSNLVLWLACANGQSRVLERNTVRNHVVFHAFRTASAVPGGFFYFADDHKSSNIT